MQKLPTANLIKNETTFSPAQRSSGQPWGGIRAAANGRFIGLSLQVAGHHKIILDVTGETAVQLPDKSVKEITCSIIESATLRGGINGGQGFGYAAAHNFM